MVLRPDLNFAKETRWHVACTAAWVRVAGARRGQAAAGDAGAGGRAACAVEEQLLLAEFGLNTYSVLLCHRASNIALCPKGMQQTALQTAVGARFWTLQALDECVTFSTPRMQSGMRQGQGPRLTTDAGDW